MDLLLIPFLASGMVWAGAAQLRPLNRPILHCPAGPALLTSDGCCARSHPVLVAVQVRQDLRDLDGVRILHFRNFEPGAFGGFSDQADTLAANDFLRVMSFEQKWCCRRAPSR